MGNPLFWITAALSWIKFRLMPHNVALEPHTKPFGFLSTNRLNFLVLLLVHVGKTSTPRLKKLSVYCDVVPKTLVGI